MLLWALIFFVIAIVAALLGFTSFAVGVAANIAKFIFFIFIGLFVISLISHYVRRPKA